MKKDLPDWAAIFKKPGTNLIKKGDHYLYFNISSHRVSGLKNPIIEQEYLGTISKDKGFVPKKVKNSTLTQPLFEYGLSHFIYSNFKRDLERSFFNSTNKMKDKPIRLAIVYYVFKFINETAINLSCISYKMESEMIEVFKTMNLDRIIRLANKIDPLIASTITDEKDRNALLAILRYTVTNNKGVSPSEYSKEAEDIIERYKLRK